MKTLNDNEIRIAREYLRKALEKGAQKARVTLDKSVMDLVGTLNGEVDKVTHNLDRSLTLNVFVDGKYGSFSTNKLETGDADDFVGKAISTARLLASDGCRDLPDPSRTEKNATGGRELDLYDDEYDRMTPALREKLALEASIFNENIVSEEAEFSDCLSDTIILDSQGLECRHTETSFEYGVEMTVADKDGNRFSDYWWDAAPRLADLKIGECCPKALERALSQIGPVDFPGGKYNMVVQSEVASKLVSPLLSALKGFSIQQNNSFLLDSRGKKVFPEGLTIIDKCRKPGDPGSRLFDSEGVSTKECPIIEKGVVKDYFLNTYTAAKLGLSPTSEDATRPMVMPFPQSGLGRDEILAICGSGIYVTGFNGGNSNSSTGDFSYGIEGFAFENGKITHPVREMLVTGNFITLWNHLIAAGDDFRVCMSKLIPTLAFSDVDFSA